MIHREIYEQGMQIAAEQVTAEETRRVFVQQILGNVFGTAITLLPAALLTARYGIAKGLLAGAAISGGLAAGIWYVSKKTGLALPPVGAPPIFTRGEG
jgi:hypothetical protein